MLPGGGTEPPTRDEFRRLEARLDAQLQAVSARVTRHDGQFTDIGVRISDVDRRCDMLSERLERRFRSVDRRFDTVEERLDLSDARQQESHREVLDALGKARRHHSKLTAYGVAGSTFATATLCFGTMIILV
jgi:hypothetical protein